MDLDGLLLLLASKKSGSPVTVDRIEARTGL